VVPEETDGIDGPLVNSREGVRKGAFGDRHTRDVSACPGIIRKVLTEVSGLATEPQIMSTGIGQQAVPAPYGG
jgi:hypothetical protein